MEGTSNFFAEGILVHNCLIIDDLVKNRSEAESKTYREKTWAEWQGTLRTRLEPNAVVVACMTIWHEDDFAGRISRLQDADEPWVVVRLPMLAEEDDLLGREAGAPLMPHRYPIEACRRLRSAVGSYEWASLYQCRPSPAAGALFKREWFRYYRREGELYHVGDRTWRARDLTRFGTVDLATSEREESDFTVGLAWGRTPDGHVLLLDNERAHMQGPDHLPMIRRLQDRNGLAVVWVESNAFQLSVVQNAVAAGLRARPLPSRENKRARAITATVQFEAGRVWFPEDDRAPWLADYEAELLGFPKAAHDDQVDATSAMAHVLEDVVDEVADAAAPPPKIGTRPGDEVRWRRGSRMNDWGPRPRRGR